jgi:hypothetical protein
MAQLKLESKQKIVTWMANALLGRLDDDAAAGKPEFNDILDEEIGRVGGIPVLKLAGWSES